MTEFSITIVLTGRCNLRCAYCYARDRRPAEPSWPVLRRALDAVLARANGAVEIGFTGGEPLLALPMLRRVVEHVERGAAPERRLRWTVLTNGLLLDDLTLDFLEARQFQVDLSFDGIDAAQAERGPGSFDTLDRLLGRIRVRAPSMWASRLRVMFTLSPPVVGCLADSVAYLVSKGVRALAVEPAMGRFEWPLERIGELEGQFQRVFDGMLDVFERTREVPLLMFRKTRADQAAPPTAWLCRAPSGENLTIDVDGAVYGCVLASSTYQARTPASMEAGVRALRAGGAGPGLAQAVAAMPAAAELAGVFQHAEARYSSYRRCADCRFLGRCHVCPLSPACEPDCDDPRRVSDFICAFHQVALAKRDAFPAKLDIFEALKRSAL